ncbi:hypothetical protein HYY69_04505 [Candidatus Woesearchaeota archaeon]|nr:hypothetical protein [Candidatus Woesearchaeota archaeon]
MAIKTIKDVDEETWYRLRKLSIKNRTPMGKLIHAMVDIYEKKTENVWENILNGEKLISDKEADTMEKKLLKVRKEYGFRV